MSNPVLNKQSSDRVVPNFLSNKQVYLFALASAVVAANAYYIHPIISLVATEFNVSPTMIGIVPALNQIALAIGILLLLPLGDRVNNRYLAAVLVFAQFIAISVMAFSEKYFLFVLSSTLLGFFTIIPYLLPAYVSKRVDPSHMGRVIGLLTSGVIGGLLMARIGAGLLGEYFGWRIIYFVAAVLLLIVSILLPILMKEDSVGVRKPPSENYFRLVLSIFPLVKAHPQVLVSGIMQSLAFSIYISIWIILGLHLTSPPMGYGVDVVGYLAILSIFNIVAVPRLGVWSDRVGPNFSRFIASCIIFVSTLLLTVSGHNLWLLIFPVLAIGTLLAVVDLTGKMLMFEELPDIRTRLMTSYIALMFFGAGISSWVATASYDWRGWNGVMLFICTLSTLLLLLAYLSFRESKRNR